LDIRQNETNVQATNVQATNVQATNVQATNVQATNVQNDASKLHCPICYNCFNNKDNIPFFLNCGHTFCKCCLDQLAQRYCPLCNQFIYSKTKNFILC